MESGLFFARYYRFNYIVIMYYIMRKILNSQIVFLFLLFGGVNLIYSQENKIDILISGGSNTQLLDFGESNLNASSYITSVGISYNLSNEFYLKTGANFGGLATFNDFSFNNYQIPLLFGFYLFSTDVTNFRFFTEFGPHLRGIYDFKDFSEDKYQEKESFGVIFNMGMHFDLNNRSFFRIFLNTNKDFNDSFVSDNDKIRMKNYAIMFGIGLKL